MAESRERVYILSQDYWGFDPSSKNDTLNFYDNVWTLKKNQYDGLSDEVRNQLYRCALFYHKSRVDNHGYTPLAIRDEGTTVKVRGPNRQGLVEMRTYISGGQSPPYVVTDGTDTITMRAADPAASDMTQLETVGGNTTPGTFTIKQFIYGEKDILDTINKLESEIGDVINLKAAEFVSPTDVLPVPSAYEESRPMAENPQSQGFSAEPEMTPASVALMVSDPYSANPPAALYSDVDVQYDPSGVEGGYTPQDTFIAAEGDRGAKEQKTHKMGPKSATLSHRLSAKARMKARNAARASKQSDNYGAEEAVPLNQEVPMGDEMRQVMTTQAFGQAGGDYDHMIHYSSETPGSDDNFVMMPDAGVDILAPANAYGTNSAIVSGQGVPQWYGSAETEVNPMYFEQVGGEDALGVGLPVVSNDFGEDSAGGIGRGVPQMYGAEHSGCSNCGCVLDSQSHKNDTSGSEGGSGAGMGDICDSCFSSKPEYSAEVNEVVYSDNVDETNVQGVPIVPNTYGEDSAIGGRGAPQWYGAEVNELVYSDDVGATNVQGVPLINNSWGNDSSIGFGRGVPQWYGSAESSNRPRNYIYNRDNELEEKINWFKSSIADLEENRVRNYDEMLHLQENRGQFSIDRRNSLNEEKVEISESIENLAQKIQHLEEEREGLNQIYLDAEGIKGHKKCIGTRKDGSDCDIYLLNSGPDNCGHCDLKIPTGLRGGIYQLGAEAPTSVAVDESSPDTYTPYEFVDGMSPDGEYMTGDDFMTLLSETIDGMGSRYQKPSMFKSPIAMTVGGGIIAAVGYMLYKR
tara:strand:+ start:1922 stop:4324 length:2403 start_codon:yes stop_codon:yes gene_type:complete